MASAHVYIVKIITRQRDIRLGKVFQTREDADAECARLLATKGQDGGVEVDDAYFVRRVVEMTEGWE
jgi:hypothetical protein